MLFECLTLYLFHYGKHRSDKDNTSEPELHSRHRRNFLGKSVDFKLELPGVEWIKRIGTKDIGGSFGVILINNMALKVCKYMGDHLSL